jgi:hypothetical protein
MDIDACEKLISKMVYEKDIRKPPDDVKNSHRGAFKVGWRKPTISESTLKKHLSWCNLGYRLKKELGDKNDDEINEIFKSFADHYLESR